MLRDDVDEMLISTSMTTYLIARNEMMCRILARRMESQDVPQPVRWHCPEWLPNGATARVSLHTIDNPDEAEPCHLAAWIWSWSTAAPRMTPTNCSIACTRSWHRAAGLSCPMRSMPR
jgi:hypothetical protein